MRVVFCVRPWPRRLEAGGKKSRASTNNTPPFFYPPRATLIGGGDGEVVEALYIFPSRPLFFTKRQFVSNCSRPLLSSAERLFRSSQGLSAAGLFMVASHRCEEAEGRLPAASYRGFNEDLLLLLLLQGAA